MGKKKNVTVDSVFFLEKKSLGWVERFNAVVIHKFFAHSYADWHNKKGNLLLFIISTNSKF